MFSDFLKDLGTYENRKIGRTDGPISVSTAYTSDEGYETALIDANDTHPVERYTTREEAVEGHARWVEFAKNADGKQVIKLTWTDFSNIIPDELILLKAVKEQPCTKES